MSEVQPLALFIEDLHWCDVSTLELLGHLIAQRPTARVMLLATARPEFLPPWPARSNLTTVQLARLTKHQARDMIQRVVAEFTSRSDAGASRRPPKDAAFSARTDGSSDLNESASVRPEEPPSVGRRLEGRLSDAVMDALVARADGVPLFVEELAKAVMEPGAAHGVEAIPATLADSLMARLDRLSAAKEVAQRAAVLGREFGYPLLAALTLRQAHRACCAALHLRNTLKDCPNALLARRLRTPSHGREPRWFSIPCSVDDRPRRSLSTFLA